VLCLYSFLFRVLVGQVLVLVALILVLVLVGPVLAGLVLVLVAPILVLVGPVLAGLVLVLVALILVLVGPVLVNITGLTKEICQRSWQLGVLVLRSYSFGLSTQLQRLPSGYLYHD